MFGNAQWKNQVQEQIRQLEAQIGELRKNDLELRGQNSKLLGMLKNLGRKLVTRLPISLESLEKGLAYDLIFPDEIDAWKLAASQGIILDIRATHEYLKASITGAYNIPYDQLSLRFESLSKEQPILIICENGIKSVAACELLSAKGYHFLYVVKGGMSLYRGPTVSHETFESIDTSIETTASAVV